MQLHDLSFDPRDPYWDTPGESGLTFAIQVFTLTNVYGLSTSATRIDTTPHGVELRCDQLTWGGGEFDSAGSVEVDVTESNGTLVFRIAASHPEQIKSIKLITRGYDPTALEAGWWHATTAHSDSSVAGHKTPVQHDYPNAGDWLTPWIAGGAGDRMATISVRNETVAATRFFAHTPPWAGGDTLVEVICEEDARHFDQTFVAPEIRIRTELDQNAVDQDFENHLDHVEATFGLEEWETRSDLPEWARGISVVVNLHGQHWTGKVFNTFDDMVGVLRFVTEHIPGEQVLAYLPGWEGRYYWQYPFFTPAEALGGADGFQRLVNEAHRLGVKLMPMFGAHGANAQIYPEWTDATFLNTTSRYPVLLNKPDWDGDRAGEDDQVFLNTGHPGFQALLIDQVTEMVTRYGIEVVYFDTTGAWFNDPRYNLFEGYQTLKRELAFRHPKVLIAGEAWTDGLLSVFPVNLSWLGSSTRFRYPQLLSRYGRAIQHLLDGAPGLGSTGVYEGGYTAADRAPVAEGHLPSISFVDDTVSDHGVDVIALLREIQGSTVPTALHN